MLAMLVVAALTRISCVHTMPSYDSQFDTHLIKVYSEDDMTPDFKELLGSQDTERELRKQIQATEDKQESTETTPREDTTTITTDKPANASLPLTTQQNSEESQAKPLQKIPSPNDEIDVVDREDHVTQYLSDLLVNTDSEITSLQGTEVEDDREGLDFTSVLRSQVP